MSLQSIGISSQSAKRRLRRLGFGRGRESFGTATSAARAVLPTVTWLDWVAGDAKLALRSQDIHLYVFARADRDDLLLRAMGPSGKLSAREKGFQREKRYDDVDIDGRISKTAEPQTAIFPTMADIIDRDSRSTPNVDVSLVH
jgi:hypothetical protein